MVVGVLDTGVANVASMGAALGSLGMAWRRCAADDDVDAAVTHVVLPGVGAFGAVRGLRERGLDRTVLRVVESGTPLLAVCLGLQLLCEGSDEAPVLPGLGVIPGRCRALPPDVSVPHLGWNTVISADAGLVRSGAAAFANSFCLREAPRGWKTSWTFHGTRFVAAVERDNVLACQFHPELSSAYGLDLIRRWIDSSQDSLGAKTVSGSSSPGAAELTVEPATNLMSRIVPCLDVCNGRVVKGVRFQELRDIGDPATCARQYEADGADEIVVLDIAAAPDGAAHQTDVVRAVREGVHIPLTVGGGVRRVADARALLGAGADKVSVNTAAVQNPELVSEMAEEFGCQCVVVAIDARRGDEGWQVRTVGGRVATGLDVVEWAHRCVRLGAGEILLTSWDRDGTRSGYDVELIQAVSSRVRVPVIGSGGGGDAHDVLAAFQSGAHAVLAASIFHDGDMTVRDLKEFLRDRGVTVRL